MEDQLKKVMTIGSVGVLYAENDRNKEFHAQKMTSQVDYVKCVVSK